MLRLFNEDKVEPSSTPMIVHSLDYKKDSFHLADDNNEILEPEVPYLNITSVLLYLTQSTRLDILVILNLLVRYRSALTRRHWIGIKEIFHYLRGMMDMSLLYPYASKFFFNQQKREHQKIEVKLSRSQDNVPEIYT